MRHRAQSATNNLCVDVYYLIWPPDDHFWPLSFFIGTERPE
jgi:hypothetical protein